MPALAFTPFVKLLGLLAVVAFLLGLGEWHGRKAIQERWDAAMAVQAVESAEAVIKSAENTARLESDFQKKFDAQARRTTIVTKEVKVYVDSPAQKCVLSPEFVSVFDRISRVHDASADGLPAPADSPGADAVLPGAEITDAAVLAAYQLAVVDLFNLWDTYHALVEWTRTSYALSKEGAGR